MNIRKKTPVLQSLLNKFAGQKACIFIKKEISALVSSFEYCEILVGTPSVHYTFPKFYVMIKFFGRLWVKNWRFSYFLYYCFVFLHNSSLRIGSQWLFRTCFDAKIFRKCNFRTHYNIGSSTVLIQSLKIRNNCRIIATSPSNVLWKMWIWAFWILCFVIIFLYKLSCKAWLKITLPKNKSM